MIVVDGKIVGGPETRREATETDERLFKVTPRGIGRGWGQCFVCGGDEKELRHDCAMFVPSRETGERIVELFDGRAHLDYRPYEPGWIQVKVCACDEHKSNLVQMLCEIDTTKERMDGPGVSAEMIKRARS